MGADYQYTNIPVKPDTADELHEDKRRGESWDEFMRRHVLDE